MDDKLYKETYLQLCNLTDQNLILTWKFYQKKMIYEIEPIFFLSCQICEDILHQRESCYIDNLHI